LSIAFTQKRPIHAGKPFDGRIAAATSFAERR
jgi:hypothetical protein